MASRSVSVKNLAPGDTILYQNKEVVIEFIDLRCGDYILHLSNGRTVNLSSGAFACLVDTSVSDVWTDAWSNEQKGGSVSG